MHMYEGRGHGACGYSKGKCGYRADVATSREFGGGGYIFPFGILIWAHEWAQSMQKQTPACPSMQSAGTTLVYL